MGNEAAAQLQLDTYGKLLDQSWRWHRRGNCPRRHYPAGPDTQDDVVEAGRALVFLAPGAAEVLDDKVLHAEAQEGQVRFRVLEQSQRCSPTVTTVRDRMSTDVAPLLVDATLLDAARWRGPRWRDLVADIVFGGPDEDRGGVDPEP